MKIVYTIPTYIFNEFPNLRSYSKLNSIRIVQNYYVYQCENYFWLKLREIMIEINMISLFLDYF